MSAVTRLLGHTSLSFTHTADPSLSGFLRALQQGRILGIRCEGCDATYVPKRTVCPKCATRLSGEVELPDTGTVTTFCVVNIPFEGQMLEPPYACAHVRLDGADVPLFHLVGGPPAQVKVGMRVKAQWAPEGARPLSLESIVCFLPLEDEA
jgi:uncharacterized OB-fold protein